MSKFADTYEPTFPDAPAPKIEDFTRASVAWAIQRYIDETDPLKKIGPTKMYVLRALQRAAIGRESAAALEDGDIIDHCRARRASGACAATVNQDVTFLTGVLEYGATWRDVKGISSVCIVKAKPVLKKYRLIGKATPRERRPTKEELDNLYAHFEKQNAHSRTKIDMVTVTRWQLASSRRISETCRLQWGDWDRENHTILVRDMKHPTKKEGNHKLVALPDEAQAMLIELEPKRERPNDPTERIFPYIAKCCSQRYTDAKRVLKIENLHLHDNRAECGTRLVEEKGFSPAEAILVTGHETTKIFERTYMRMNPRLFKLGPVALRKQQERQN